MCLSVCGSKGIRGGRFAVCPDLAHGKAAPFAVCPAIRHTAKKWARGSGVGPAARVAHVASGLARRGRGGLGARRGRGGLAASVAGGGISQLCRVPRAMAHDKVLCRVPDHVALGKDVFCFTIIFN